MRLNTSNNLWHAVYAASFAAMVVAGAVYSGIALRNYQLNEEKSVLKGQVALDIEHYYNENFIARDIGTNLWALINYTAFNEGRVGVVIGNNSWLYSLEEFKDYPDSEKNLERNLSAINAVAEYAKAQGTDLVVALVPEKATVYSEFLTDKVPAPVHQSLYSYSLTYLQDKAVTTVDLATALSGGKSQGQVFLKSDTHWTPLGASLAARQIANTLAQTSNSDLLNQMKFVSASETAISFHGDLLNFIPLGPFSRWLEVSSDQLVKTTTQQESDADSTAQSTDLFGESSTAIALVGTSYSANPSWNFPGALKQHMGADLINFAQEGKGPFVPMIDYLSSEDFSQSPPALLIWEIPVRFLLAPQGDQLVPSFISVN